MAPDEAGEKPYALLFDALKKTGYVGVAKVAMHNREHIVILRPGQKRRADAHHVLQRMRSARWTNSAPTSAW